MSPLILKSSRRPRKGHKGYHQKKIPVARVRWLHAPQGGGASSNSLRGKADLIVSRGGHLRISCSDPAFLDRIREKIYVASGAATTDGPAIKLYPSHAYRTSCPSARRVKHGTDTASTQQAEQ
jgi:hypothetical protein